MGKPSCGDEEFAELFTKLGPRRLAEHLGICETNIRQRRNRIERRNGIEIAPPTGRSKFAMPAPKGEHRLKLDVPNGVVIVASDAHYWPGEATVMHKALVNLTKELHPKSLILNGDVMDFPSISRHARIAWEARPNIIDEIEWAQEKLHELVLACPKGCRKIWTLGNHDARFETRIANLAPEYAKVNGVHLSDHFPLWEPCWSVWINDDVVVKHRFKGGIHATRNNTLHAGKNIVTGHLHSAKVSPITDYNGTRWGVDSGCLAEPTARAFVEYTEDNPLDWRSAFVVLTFKEGKLLQPELVLKFDEERVQFRGELF